MLIHIVCWKYKPEVTEEQRQEHREKLQNLKGSIAEIVDLKVGADVLHISRAYDTGLVVTFKDLQDLEVYSIHPIHQEVVNLGKQIAANVISVDFFDKSAEVLE